jgi:hypothetical protein
VPDLPDRPPRVLRKLGRPEPLWGSRADGSPTLHRNGEALHGHFFGQSSLATLALAPSYSVVKVPREAPLELLGPLACGVQTGAQFVLNVLRPEPGSTLAVFGAGGVGLSAVIAAVHLTGATVVVVDVNPARLELATRLGAAHTINAREDDPVDALQQISGGGGIDRTLEATGVPSVLRQAIDVLAPRGVCGIVGAPAPDAEVSMNILTAIVKGSSVVGINQGDPVPRDAIPAMVELPGPLPLRTSSSASTRSTRFSRPLTTLPTERSSSRCFGCRKPRASRRPGFRIPPPTRNRADIALSRESTFPERRRGGTTRVVEPQGPTTRSRTTGDRAGRRCHCPGPGVRQRGLRAAAAAAVREGTSGFVGLDLYTEASRGGWARSTTARPRRPPRRRGTARATS